MCCFIMFKPKTYTVSRLGGVTMFYFSNHLSPLLYNIYICHYIKELIHESIYGVHLVITSLETCYFILIYSWSARSWDSLKVDRLPSILGQLSWYVDCLSGYGLITSSKSHIVSVSMTDWCLIIYKKN